MCAAGDLRGTDGAAIYRIPVPVRLTQEWTTLSTQNVLRVAPRSSW